MMALFIGPNPLPWCVFALAGLCALKVLWGRRQGLVWAVLCALLLSLGGLWALVQGKTMEQLQGGVLGVTLVSLLALLHNHERAEK